MKINIEYVLINFMNWYLNTKNGRKSIQPFLDKEITKAIRYNNIKLKESHEKV